MAVLRYWQLLAIFACSAVDFAHWLRFPRILAGATGRQPPRSSLGFSAVCCGALAGTATGFEFLWSSSKRRSVTERMRVVAFLGSRRSGNRARRQMVRQGRFGHRLLLVRRLCDVWRSAGVECTLEPLPLGNGRRANSSLRSLGPLRRDPGRLCGTRRGLRRLAGQRSAGFGRTFRGHHRPEPRRLRIDPAR